MNMTASALASALITSGGSASSGSMPSDARHAIAHVVGRGIDVAADVELDAHLRAFVLALRFDLQNAFDAGDRILDDLRDLGFDHRRGSAVVVRR